MRAWVGIAGAVVLSAVLQTVIFPVAGPLPVWRAALAWVAMVPWFVVLLRLPAQGWRGVRALAAWSYLCGILWYFGHCYWVYDTMHDYGGLSAPMAALVLFLFCCYLGLYHLLFGAVVGMARWAVPAGSRWMVLALPVLWVAVELARSRVTSFPWDLLGYAQVDNSLLTRMVPWAGVYAISFVLALANAAFAWAHVQGTGYRSSVGQVAALTATMIAVLGWILHVPSSPAGATAILVQPNLVVGRAEPPVQPSQDLPLVQVLANLSKAAEPPSPPRGTPQGQQQPLAPQVVLWPESPAPFEVQEALFQQTLSDLSSDLHAPVLAGAVQVEAAPGKRRPRVYNSAALFLPGVGLSGLYRKIHLVPFGEFTPYASLFSFASGLTEAVGNFDRGTSRAPLVAAGHRYGLFICYESIFGDEVRQFVRGGADVLVNLSDDGWYGDTSAPFQHINMARMRAMENRRWILRDTNTGITATIDPYGTVRAVAPRHVRTAVMMPFAYATEMTFYTQHGDWFAYLCAAATTALVLAAVTKRYAQA